MHSQKPNPESRGWKVKSTATWLLDGLESTTMANQRRRKDVANVIDCARHHCHDTVNDRIDRRTMRHRVVRAKGLVKDVVVEPVPDLQGWCYQECECWEPLQCRPDKKQTSSIKKLTRYQLDRVLLGVLQARRIGFELGWKPSVEVLGGREQDRPQDPYLMQRWRRSRLGVETKR